MGDGAKGFKIRYGIAQRNLGQISGQVSLRDDPTIDIPHQWEAREARVFTQSSTKFQNLGEGTRDHTHLKLAKVSLVLTKDSKSLRHTTKLDHIGPIDAHTSLGLLDYWTASLARCG